MLDQFYWAERMFWLGVASEPLKRCHLIPDTTDDACIKEAADMLSSSLSAALSDETQARCSEISSRISIQVTDLMTCYWPSKSKGMSFIDLKYMYISGWSY